MNEGFDVRVKIVMGLNNGVLYQAQWRDGEVIDWRNEFGSRASWVEKSLVANPERFKVLFDGTVTINSYVPTVGEF